MLLRNLLVGFINNLKDRDQIERACSLLNRYDAFSEAYDELNDRYQKTLDKLRKPSTPNLYPPTPQQIQLTSLYLKYLHQLLETLDLDFVVDETISLYEKLHQQSDSMLDTEADVDAAANAAGADAAADAAGADADAAVTPLLGVDP